MPQPGASLPLRVVTLNIRNGRALDGANSWPFRRRWVPGYIRDLDADVIGLQEPYHHQVMTVERALSGYVRVGVGRDDGRKGGEYCPLYVRSNRLSVMEHGTFWFSDTPHMPGSCTWGNTLPRVCTWALLARAEAPQVPLIRVCNVHLDHASAPARQKSAELLRRMLSDWRSVSPVALMGDFNVVEDDPVVAVLLAEPDGLRDAFRLMHPEARAVGTFHGWTGKADGPRIDYILVTPDLTVLDAEIRHDVVGGRLPSDHWPVTALLQVADRADGST